MSYHEFVETCFAAFRGRDPGNGFEAALQGIKGDNWQRWIDQHDVHGILLPLFQEAGREDLAAFCQTRKRRVAARNLELFEVRDRVARILADHEVPLVWLKGMALTEALYPAIGWRSSSDLDALVREQDLDLVRKVLAEQGFSSTAGEEAYSSLKGKQTFAAPGIGAKLELHWRLTLSSKFPLPPDPIGSGWADPEKYRLRPALEWLFLACHNVQHLAVSRWVWLWDLHLLGKRMTKDDWVQLNALTKEYDLFPVVDFSCTLLELFFGERPAGFGRPFKIPACVQRYLTTMKVQDLEAGKLSYFWRTIGNPVRFAGFLAGFIKRTLVRPKRD